MRKKDESQLNLALIIASRRRYFRRVSFGLLVRPLIRLSIGQPATDRAFHRPFGALSIVNT